MCTGIGRRVGLVTRRLVKREVNHNACDWGTAGAASFQRKVTGLALACGPGEFHNRPVGDRARPCARRGPRRRGWIGVGFGAPQSPRGDASGSHCNARAVERGTDRRMRPTAKSSQEQAPGCRAWARRTGPAPAKRRLLVAGRIEDLPPAKPALSTSMKRDAVRGWSHRDVNGRGAAV